MTRKYVQAIFLFCCISFSTESNILAIFPIPSPSHHIWNSPLVVALANRGHNVTVVSPIAQKKIIPNLTDLEITGIIDAMQSEYDYVEMGKLTVLQLTEMDMIFGLDTCKKLSESQAWNQLMNYSPDTKFDLIIMESLGSECVLGSLQKFGDFPPIIAVNAFNVPPWLMGMVGTPNMVSHIPHFNTIFTDNMIFKERVQNLIYNAYTYYKYHYHYLPEMDKMAREMYGPQTPSIYEVYKHISLGMSSFHPALDYSWARTPNLIPVAGIQLQEPKPLPQDIKTFLDDAKEGAILFSLGTNIKSTSIPSYIKEEIIDAFSELPQKVLWKIDEESFPSLPKNVKIAKWLPQSDILAHPNLKLFISHSGLLSTHEAIYRGVPMIGIPFFVDQPINIKKMITLGTAISLDHRSITKQILTNAIKTILEDPSYKENMKTLSKIFRDELESPLERAVFWTEYILRHKGAPHLRSAALDLNMVQFLLLDVIAFMLAIPTLFTILLYCLCCRQKKYYNQKLKTN